MSFRIGDKVTVHTKGYDPKKVYVIVDILYYPENERYAYDFPDLLLNNGDFISAELCHIKERFKTPTLRDLIPDLLRDAKI